jgi:hypothetical protein
MIASAQAFCRFIPSPRATNHTPTNQMSTTTTKPARTFDLRYYVAQTIKTRTFGHTYVHAGGRSQFQHGDVTFYVEGYGRSLQGGGHKYKVKAYRDGKPVSTKELRAL